MATRTEKRTVKIIMDGSQAAKTIAELDKDIKILGQHMRYNLKPGTDEFRAAAAQMTKLREQGQQWRGEMGLMSRGLQQLKTQFLGVTLGVVGGSLMINTMSAISGFFSGAIDNYKKLASLRSDVQKTTELDLETVKGLEKSLMSIDTIKTRTELMGLAYEAGKLGKKSVEDIRVFVDEAQIIDVALGQELGEDAIRQIGKISAAFRTGMLNVGSGINAVAASSRANEGYLVDFLARTQSAGETLGFLTGDMIGYGATLDSFGLQVEMAGTALNNTLNNFVRDAEKFERVAGMADGSLRKLMAEKGNNEAFMQFLEALKAGSKGAQDFLNKLDKLGIDGARGAQVFQVLANNLEDVRKNQKLANEEVAKGTSVLDEFAIKNNDANARWIKNIKEVERWFFQLRTTVAGVMAGVLDWFVRNGSAVLGFVKILTVGTAAWVAYRVAVWLANTSMMKFGLTQALVAKGLALQRVAALVAAVAYGVLTGNIMYARAAMLAFNVATKMNPIGLLVGVLTTAIGLWVAFGGKVSATTKIMQDARTEGVKSKVELQRLNAIVQSNTLSEASRASAIGKLRDMMPGYLDHLTDEQIRTGAATDAIRQYITALENKTRAMGFANLAADKAKDLAEGEVKVEDLVVQQSKFKGKTDERSLVITQKYDKEIAEQKEKNRVVEEEITKITRLQTRYETLGDVAPVPFRPPDLFDGVITSRASVTTPGTFDPIRVTSKKSPVVGDNTQPPEQSTGRTQTVETLVLEYRKKTIKELNTIIKDGSEMEKEAAQTAIENRKVELTYITNTKKLYEDLRRIKIEAITNEESREIAGLQLKTELRVNEIRETSASEKIKSQLITEERTSLQTKISALETKYAKERKDEEFKISKENLDKWFSVENLRISEQYSRNEISYKEYTDSLSTLDIQYLEQKKTVYTDYQESTTEIDQQIADRKIAINQEEYEHFISTQEAKLLLQIELTEEGTEARRDAELEYLDWQMEQELLALNLSEEEKLLIYQQYQNKRKELSDEELKHEREMKQAMAVMETAMVDAVQTIITRRVEKKSKDATKAEQVRYNKELDALDNRLKKGSITEEQYQQQKDKLDEEHRMWEASIKRDAWLADKKATMTMAAIQGALGIIRALASAPPPANFINAAAVGVVTGIQLGLMEAQPVPEFAKGTQFTDKIIQGPRHSEGGMPIIDPKTGKKVAEIEGGETLLSKDTTRKNYGLVMQLLHSSRYKGGAPLKDTYQVSDKRARKGPEKILVDDEGKLIHPNGRRVYKNIKIENTELPVLSYDSVSDAAQKYQTGGSFGPIVMDNSPIPQFDYSGMSDTVVKFQQGGMMGSPSMASSASATDGAAAALMMQAAQMMKEVMGRGIKADVKLQEPIHTELIIDQYKLLELNQALGDMVKIQDSARV